MLKAFKDQLRVLSIDPKDQFHMFIRKRVGKKATQILEKKLKKLILLTPGLVSRIYSVWSGLKAPLEIKRASGFLLTYMYHPKDFLAEDSLGLFGYLDDAYLVATVYERLIDELNERGLGATQDDERMASEIRSLKKSAKLVIRPEAEKIEKMVAEILEGKRETFNAIFN